MGSGQDKLPFGEWGDGQRMPEGLLAEREGFEPSIQVLARMLP